MQISGLLRMREMTAWACPVTVRDAINMRTCKTFRGRVSLEHQCSKQLTFSTAFTRSKRVEQSLGGKYLVHACKFLLGGTGMVEIRE